LGRLFAQTLGQIEGELLGLLEQEALLGIEFGFQLQSVDQPASVRLMRGPKEESSWGLHRGYHQYLIQESKDLCTFVFASPYGNLEMRHFRIAIVVGIGQIYAQVLDGFPQKVGRSSMASQCLQGQFIVLAGSDPILHFPSHVHYGGNGGHGAVDANVAQRFVGGHS